MMESKKNRLQLIFSISLVSMILITSQSLSAFAGFVDRDDDGFQDIGFCDPEKRPTCDPNDADPCDPDPSSENCVPLPPPPIMITTDVDGVVVGPDEMVIISNGATVDGDIEVNGGTVIITESSIIKGNIESNGGTIVINQGGTIYGNVDIVVSGPGGVLEIEEGNVFGNLITNGIDTLTVIGSYVDGNIFSENDVDVTITGNSVNGNLEILAPSSCTESSNDVNGNNFGCP